MRKWAWARFWKAYQGILVDFPVRSNHGLYHELVAVLFVGIILERLEAH